MPKKRRKSGKRLKKVLKLIFVFVLLVVILASVTYFANELAEKNSYSVEYKEEIIKYSKKYSLNPALVAAVMHCESSNDVNALSNKGAMGLMQIMPETGDWIADKLEIQDYNSELLYNKDINIEFGCWYLSFLKERFHGEFINYVAAYNAGHGKVEAWLKESEYSKDGVLVSIPYKETREYVKRVEKAMEKYEELYDGVY